MQETITTLVSIISRITNLNHLLYFAEGHGEALYRRGPDGESRPFWSTGTVACTEPGGPEFESRTQLVVTDCELLRFEDCIFAPQSCKCYGYLSSKVE